MDILEAIKKRKSVREFKLKPVPQGILQEILQRASRAPSAMNTQPWEFIVLSGDVLDNIRRENIEMLNAGTPPKPEHSVIGWPSDSVFRQRQVELAKELFTLMEIPREDKKKRTEWMERGFRYFNAPAAIILLSDRSLSEVGPLLDMGAVMQNICLAALKYGLGTCIEDQGVMYPQILRKFVDIPDSKRIIISIAIGYPNWEFPANKLESTRESIENITTWHGFE